LLYYGYNAAGHLQYRTNCSGQQTFTVDTLNQLTQVTRAAAAFPVKGNSSASASSVTVNGSPATLETGSVFTKSLTLANEANT
jgi:hypothetical protein